MTRRVLAYLCTFAMLLVSCSVSETEVPSSEGNVLTVSLNPGKMGLTRASEYGEDKFNENVIRNFKLYFYTEGSNDDAEAVYVYPSEGYAMDPANEAATVSGTTGTDPTTGKVTVKLKLTDDAIKRIFPSNSTACRVYGIANIARVSDGQQPTSTSINALKKIIVKTNFGPDASVSEPPYAKAQNSFVMDGEGALTLNQSSRTVSGEVPLSRAASKITFKVTKISKDGVADKEWEPQSSEMNVYFINGINVGYVNGKMDKTSRQGASKELLFSYKSASSDSNCPRPLVGNESSGWTHELPFYSYYSLWRDPENSSNDDCGEAPYLLLSLPWKNADRYFTCWYAVPFNTLEGHLDRNTWYKINLSVNILGSGDPDNPTVLTPSYMILPWGNEVETNANLMRYRYLMVDQNYYEMHNVNSLTIPFISSHEVEVASVSLKYYNLYPNTSNNKYKPVEMESQEYYTCTVDNNNQSMTFTHALNNEYGSSLHVSAFTLKVRLRHKDADEFYEDLTIVQYPALYVKAEMNSRCTNPEKGITSNDKPSQGYTFVNKNRSYSGDNWQQVYNFPSGGEQDSNYDPYMYIITPSSLPATGAVGNLVIGDPREENCTDFEEFNSTTWDWWGNKKTTYWATEASSIARGNNVRLAEYYPTRSSDDVNNMIAPSFRIASSYGVVHPISYKDAKKRCAAYQEDGYPAGRWRVPTRAEIYYMVMLKTYGRIPVLLSSGSYYWGSDGKGYSPTDSGDIDERDGGSCNVRCVYDEWYWTDINESNKTKYRSTFIWGDKQR